jgi:hypothetical protein
VLCREERVNSKSNLSKIKNISKGEMYHEIAETTSIAFRELELPTASL